MTNAKVDMLLKASFIREVHHSNWLSNVVIVNKKNGKWQVCVDSMDLSRSYPMDPFSLPIINQLLDFMYGCSMFSFLDAYSRYDQIKMNHKDEEKTSFITRKGINCYKAMRFGLKNAGTTYQYLVTKLFEGLLGKVVKAYIDDTIVKSTDFSTHLSHLELVFQCLVRH